MRLKDVAEVELAALDYSSNSYLDVEPAVALAVFQRPGSNALDTAHRIRETMEQLSKRFPPGLEYKIIYDPTQFIQQSVDEVKTTIFEAILLVVLVVVLFLQTWRAAVIPLLAIPVSLVGTFFLMSLFGFTLNNLSLFGLVLAVGIVVDDAIVVVENVERNIAAGLSPRDAAVKSMDEVGSALIAIALVLCAVFIPTVFITGISGQFYRQFALTIAGATIISLVVSLTLSPAMCALLLKPHDTRQPPFWARPLHAFFRMFNWGFDRVAAGYGWLSARVVRFAVLTLVVYAGILAFGLNEFRKTPVGFIPQLDRGYLIVVTQLPPGASLSRTDAVNRRTVELAKQVPGVAGAVNVVGFSGATFTVAPNAGAVFVVLDPFEERAGDPNKSANAIIRQLYGKLGSIQEALILVVPPPPVQGIGNAGGFRMMVEDRAGRGSQPLLDAVNAVMARARQAPEVANVFSLFEVSTPQLYLDIDRTKAQLLGVNVADVFTALQIYIGSLYVNDFNLFGRTFRVTAQAADRFRHTPEDVLKLRVRNATGGTVPLGSFTTVNDIAGPYRVPRYNLYPAAEIDGVAAPGYSQSQAIAAMERIANEVLPDGFSYEWTTLAFQQLRAGSTAMFAFSSGGGVRVPGAGGAVREPHAAACDHHDRADVPGRVDHRRRDARARQQHPDAGRFRRADRARRQERDPDHRIRQAARGPGPRPLRRRGRGGQAAAAADPDDVVRLHLRRGAAGVGAGRGRRTAAGARHGGVRRHDRRDVFRADLHARVLRRRALDRRKVEPPARGTPSRRRLPAE